MVTNERAFLQKMSKSSPEELLQAVRRTHDYKRHGTTSLFVALDIATGSVIGKCWPRHRAIEFRKFLNQTAGSAKNTRKSFKSPISVGWIVG